MDIQYNTIDDLIEAINQLCSEHEVTTYREWSLMLGRPGRDEQLVADFMPLLPAEVLYKLGFVQTDGELWEIPKQLWQFVPDGLTLFTVGGETITADADAARRVEHGGARYGFLVKKGNESVDQYRARIAYLTPRSSFFFTAAATQVTDASKIIVALVKLGHTVEIGVDVRMGREYGYTIRRAATPEGVLNQIAKCDIFIQSTADSLVGAAEYGMATMLLKPTYALLHERAEGETKLQQSIIANTYGLSGAFTIGSVYLPAGVMQNMRAAARLARREAWERKTAARKNDDTFAASFPEDTLELCEACEEQNK